MIHDTDPPNKPRRIQITITVLTVEPGLATAPVNDRLRGYFRAMVGTWPNDADFARRRERRQNGGTR